MRLCEQAQLQLKKANQRAVQMALPVELYFSYYNLLPSGHTEHKREGIGKSGIYAAHSANTVLAYVKECIFQQCCFVISCTKRVRKTVLFMISKTMGFKGTRGSILLKALYCRHNKITAKKNLNIQSTAKTFKKKFKMLKFILWLMTLASTKTLLLLLLFF